MKRRSRVLNIGLWLVIVILAAVIAVFTIWAARQPDRDYLGASMRRPNAAQYKGGN